MADEPSRRHLPGWLFVVVPMVLAALLVGGVAIAVRGGGDDDGGEDISGPAAELPAVVDAAADLGTTTDPAALGARYAEITRAFETISDDVDFAASYDRLPDAEAQLLGRSLGAIQAQLSPTAVGGARGDDDRAADIVFTLGLARGVVQSLDPEAKARDQALAVLPYSVQDLVGFEEVAEMFASGDLAELATRIDRGESGESATDGALSDAGAAELVSSVAFLLGQRLPAGDDTRDESDDYATMFMDAYNAALPL